MIPTFMISFSSISPPSAFLILFTCFPFFPLRLFTVFQNFLIFYWYLPSSSLPNSSHDFERACLTVLFYTFCFSTYWAQSFAFLDLTYVFHANFFSLTAWATSLFHHLVFLVHGLYLILPQISSAAVIIYALVDIYREFISCLHVCQIHSKHFIMLLLCSILL